jgi:superfamily II DNA or RNA helicase
LLTLKKNNAQSYSLTADRGKASERDKAVQSIIYRHRKRVEGYLFTGAYKSGKWDGFTYNFKPANIRAGFLRETIEHLNSFQIPWQWDNNEPPKDLPFPVKDEFDSKDFSEFCKTYIEAFTPKFRESYGVDFEVRPYQIEASWKAINNKTGIIRHATGAGKSFVIALTLAYLFHKGVISKAVIVVPRQSLTTQFKGDLIDFGFNEDRIGLILSGQKQTNKPLTIVMNQSLRTMKDTLMEGEFLSKVDFVICDEVHTASAETVSKSILSFTTSKYFLGFTGTIPENELDADTLYSMFGYVIDDKGVTELSGSVLSTVTVGILTFNYGKKSKESKASRVDSSSDWNSEVQFLQNDDVFRNPYIVNMIENNYKKGMKLVVLVKNIEYGNKMFKLVKEKCDKNIYWVDGSMSLKDRDDIIKKCKKSEDPYVILTNYQIFSTGINIPNISGVFLIDGGKSKITIAQTIGRGVRKTQIKNSVIILDCACDLKYGARHARQRKKLYEDEGFKVIEKMAYLNNETEDLERRKKCLQES